MKSLKDRLMFWKSGKAPAAAVPTFDFHNELLISPGQFLSLDILDYRDENRKVTGYNEWRREILGATYRFTDYSFEDTKIKLRAYDESADKDDNVWLMTLYFESSHDEGLLDALSASCETPDSRFDINGDDGSLAQYQRLNGLKEPYLAFTYPNRGKVHYWDFQNVTNPEELLYVEQDLNDGSIKMWLAKRIFLSNIMVI